MIKTRIFMPGIKHSHWQYIDSKQTFDHLKHAANHFFYRKVRTQLFLRNRIFMLAQSLAIKSQIPGGNILGTLVASKIAQLGEITFGKSTRLVRQDRKSVV